MPLLLTISPARLLIEGVTRGVVFFDFDFAFALTTEPTRLLTRDALGVDADDSDDAADEDDWAGVEGILEEEPEDGVFEDEDTRGAGALKVEIVGGVDVDDVDNDGADVFGVDATDSIFLPVLL